MVTCGYFLRPKRRPVRPSARVRRGVSRVAVCTGPDAARESAATPSSPAGAGTAPPAVSRETSQPAGRGLHGGGPHGRGQGVGHPLTGAHEHAAFGARDREAVEHPGGLGVQGDLAEGLDPGQVELHGLDRRERLPLPLDVVDADQADAGPAAVGLAQPVLQTTQPLSGVHDPGHVRAHHADDDVGLLQQRQVDGVRVGPAGVHDDVVAGQVGERRRQGRPQRADRLRLLRAGEPGHHLLATHGHLGVVQDDLRGEPAPGQRQQAEQAAVGAQRVAVRGDHPQRDVTAHGVGVDEDRGPRPQRGGEHRRRADTRRPLRGEQGDESHACAPTSSSGRPAGGRRRAAWPRRAVPRTPAGRRSRAAVGEQQGQPSSGRSPRRRRSRR